MRNNVAAGVCGGWALSSQALELRELFNTALRYFATNKFLQLTAAELEELEQQRNEEKQRIE